MSAFDKWFVKQFGKREERYSEITDTDLDSKLVVLSANYTSAQMERDRRRWWDDAYKTALYAWQQARRKHKRPSALTEGK